MLWCQQPVVCECYLSRLDGVGHLGEIIWEALRRRDVVPSNAAAALAKLRIRRIRGLPAALRGMLGPVMHGVLALVESWVFVHLPHLEVVYFFHHWLPQPNPCIDKPV